MNLHENIRVTRSYSPETGYGSGDLTAKQYVALETVARLSPGYTFEVVRYSQQVGMSGSSATHVMVYKNDVNVALVGRDTAQFYDGDKTTEQVVKRVSNRVYRTSVQF